MARLIRFVATLTLSGTLALLAHTAAFAGGSVDPSTLTPPPYGDNISCMSTGSGITCQSDQSASYSYIDSSCVDVNPTYAFDVLLVINQTIHTTWHYTSSGELLAADIHVLEQDSYTNLATKRAGVGRASFTETHTLVTPGDLYAGDAVRTTGLRAQITVPGSGTIALAAGLAVYPVLGEPFFHGPNRPIETFGPLCAALAG